MEKFLKNLKRNCVLAFIGFVIIGILLIIFPDIVAKMAGYIIGAVVLAFGVTKILGYFKKEEENRTGIFGLTIGVIAGIAGLYVIVKPEIISNFIISIFGVIILVNGITKLSNAFKLKRSKIKNWYAVMASGAISLLLGIAFITNPELSHDLMIRVLGGVLIFEGVSNLWTIISLSSVHRNEVKRRKEIEGTGREIDSEDID